jgi:predicted nuclease of predicted toxin-antitoxin system
VARQRCAAIITKDEDFVRLATLEPSGPSVIWLRVGSSTQRDLLCWMERAWPAVVTALEAGEPVAEVSS